MELYYKRVESVRKGRVHPARTQTVVIFLPDVRSCVPTALEYDELTMKYKKRLDMKLQSNHSKSVDREIDDRVEKKSIAQDESETAINDGDNGDGGDGDIEMADGSSNQLDKSMTATDGDNQSKATDSSDATKATDRESSGQTSTAATSSSDISKALHKNIISNNITMYLFRCSVFSLF